MSYERDLVIVAADKSIEYALRGLIARLAASTIRSLTFDVYVHPGHDPGCRLTATELVRGFMRTHERVLVVFDREGSGSDDASDAIAASVEARLAANGWGGRGAAIVIDPELEAWLWIDSPHVVNALGWTGSYAVVRKWLEEEGFTFSSSGKPIRPKDAFLRCLRAKNIPQSASIFRDLAATVTLDRCTNPAFVKLCSLLQAWFPSRAVRQG